MDACKDAISNSPVLRVGAGYRNIEDLGSLCDIRVDCCIVGVGRISNERSCEEFLGRHPELNAGLGCSGSESCYKLLIRNAAKKA